MERVSVAIERFFRNFERSRESGDAPDVPPQFADTFMFAGPEGVKCIRGADFAAAIPKRKQLFDSLGWQSTALASLEESRLDSRFVMAKTQWRMRFARGQAGSEDVVVGSIYLVDVGEEPFKIVFYLAHEDIVTVLKERGLLPG